MEDVEKEIGHEAVPSAAAAVEHVRYAQLRHRNFAQFRQWMMENPHETVDLRKAQFP